MALTSEHGPLGSHCHFSVTSFVPQQVNGTMVTNSSHLEVVKLIKCELERGASERKSGSRCTGATGGVGLLTQQGSSVDVGGG